MKKFLIASTALVALSGAAAAEITLSGDAQIGLKYDNRLWDDNNGVEVSGWNLQQRARFTVTMTGETDSGLSFGAKFRPAASGYNESRDSFTGTSTVWAEGAYGKITVGDVDSAIEQAIGDLVGVGNSGLEFYNEMYYFATDIFGGGSYSFLGGSVDGPSHNNKGLVYSYKYGDATFFASFEDQYVGYSGDKYEGNSWSLGASYSMNQYSFGIGYSVTGEILGEDVKTLGLSASGDFNGLTGKLIYIESKAGDLKLRQYGIGADYTMANGVGLQGFYRQNKLSVPGDSGKQDFIGFGASYDLGGGASVNGGIVREKISFAGDSESRTIADFGLRFAF